MASIISSPLCDTPFFLGENVAVTGFLNTTNPVAELVAELNPDFEQRHKLDKRNVGVLLGDLTEVYDSMRLSMALEDLHKLPTGTFEPAAATELKELS